MLRNFRFLIKNELAGMGHPGDRHRLAETLCALRQEGIGAIVSLDEEGLPDDVVAQHGFVYRHYPIDDFCAPTLEQAGAFVRFVDEQLADGRAVVAHCWAGIGRTGTMLACYLIHRGQSAGEAQRKVRRLGGIESREQEQFLREFEQAWRNEPSGRTDPGDEPDRRVET
ncbi:hypothetical protein AMJ85_01990 [candidate division BRC1 bacterium SM23_51]|nr:MAG: hypothetical protein AMJ85_01990 [candidate division BRC1 bacterium SM23_51]